MYRIARVALTVGILFGLPIEVRSQNSIATEQLRSRYAAVFEQQLLKRGLDVRVSAQPPKGERLLVLGFAVDRVLIFNLISYASLLETAQERGFKLIDFISEVPGGGRWTFDLSKPGPPPKCSATGRVICRE